VKFWHTVKDVDHDVKTRGMTITMSRHCDNTNNKLKVNAEIKWYKIFFNSVRFNVTYIWGLPSQEGNSL